MSCLPLEQVSKLLYWPSPHCSRSSDHEHIEAEETERERRFQGGSPDSPVGEDQPIQDPLNQYEEPAELSGDAQKVIIPSRPPGAGSSKPARIDRSKPGSAREELHRAKAEADGLPVYGVKDFHRPRSAQDKLRKGMPYSA